MKETETQKAIEVDDLQNQVRDHIRSHDLFNWHEALSENEMSLLENLLLTFAPMFSPGSIGFAKTVQPYLAIAGRSKSLEEKEKEIADRNNYYENKIDMLNRIGAENEKQLQESLLLYQNMVNTISEKDKEIERLKGLIREGFSLLQTAWGKTEEQKWNDWEKFKTENKL